MQIVTQFAQNKKLTAEIIKTRKLLSDYLWVSLSEWNFDLDTVHLSVLFNTMQTKNVQLKVSFWVLINICTRDNRQLFWSIPGNITACPLPLSIFMFLVRQLHSKKSNIINNSNLRISFSIISITMHT